MKIRSFKNIFGKDCYVYIKSSNLSASDIKYVIDLFKSKKLLFSIVALDYNSEFFNIISKKDTFKIFLPTSNEITSETRIISNAENILVYWDKLINSNPRCITIYGLNGSFENNNVLVQKNVKNEHDTELIRNNIIDFVLSILIDENFTVLSFNKTCFDLKQIVDKIKVINT